MALTKLQRTICRLIAQNRIESGEIYVAGGVALNEALGASRVSSDSEVSQLAFDGPRPSARDLSQKWRAMIEDARGIVAALPPAEAGKAVLLKSGELCRDPFQQLGLRLSSQRLHFHEGRVRGALPTVVSQ